MTMRLGQYLVTHLVAAFSASEHREGLTREEEVARTDLTRLVMMEREDTRMYGVGG